MEKGLAAIDEYLRIASHFHSDAREGLFLILRALFDVPVEPRGTPFQERVWRALLRVPFGATCSYGDLARAAGRPGAARAVGGANHANPIALIVPCHRVIAADGTLGGYGGGLDKKAWLLRHEGGEVVARAAAR
jgi:methylated-DNA-[protein]-cysteine S-methyltransferase